MHLFVHSGGLVFSLMLAVVLAGIGLGGFAGGFWLRRDPGGFRHAPALALLSGALSAALYFGFSFAIAPYTESLIADPGPVLRLSFVLMFPISFVSGILFTFIGSALHREVSPETRATGLLTLANTLGGALGSAIGGFVLLPMLGMESSFFALGASYGIVGLLLWGMRAADSPSVRSPLRIAFAGLFVVAMALFPFGIMESDYLRISIERWDEKHEMKIAAVREGRIETIVYLRKELDGEPVFYQLLTNGFSMSATTSIGRRYQRLYVFWPVALRPDPKRALVISCGAGSTAKGLVETRSLEHIDVVDISRAILELSDLVYPDPDEHPLNDPRVHVHIEDGRYFLQATEARYDIITADPPPPKNAGVVNLYTQEYFQLIWRSSAASAKSSRTAACGRGTTPIGCWLVLGTRSGRARRPTSSASGRIRSWRGNFGRSESRSPSRWERCSWRTRNSSESSSMTRRRSWTITRNGSATNAKRRRWRGSRIAPG